MALEGEPGSSDAAEHRGQWQAPQVPVQTPAAPASSYPSSIATALEALRATLDFETASLFAPTTSGWELVERVGPDRAWHGILDPAMLEGTPEAAEYADARTLPGVGSRLANLGCRSLASVPLPDGTRVLLDSSRVSHAGGWIERARPYLRLVSVVAGPSWSSGALEAREEIRVLARAFEACQELMGEPGSTVGELLTRVREAVHADELFLLADRGADLEAQGSPDLWVTTINRREAGDLRVDPHGRLDDADVQRLATTLGASSRAVAGALGREGPVSELLLAGWSQGPALSPVAMGVLARAVSTARAALVERGEAVSTLVGRERARMAYALHDDLTQTVTGAILELEALRSRIKRDPGEAIAVLDSSKAEIRRALSELRAILFDLQRSSSDVSDATSAEPLSRYVDDIVRRWRLPARVEAEGDLGRIPARVLSVAYVVVREALTNAAKHAPGRTVNVRLSAGPSALTVVVADAGRGFTRADLEAARNERHFGLEMLRRRVEEVGGSLTIDSSPGEGTRVVAEIPITGARS